MPFTLSCVTGIATSLYFHNAKNEIRNITVYVLDYSRCDFQLRKSLTLLDHFQFLF